MTKTIQEYLPVKAKCEKTSQRMVQGRVPSEVVIEVKKIMKSENLSWTDVLTACLRCFLDEKGQKKK